MYHDTIHINFKYSGGVNFDYSFLISKIPQDKFSPIKYTELLKNFYDIGFDLKYLKFYDIDDEDYIVYCTYNYQPNFNIFFSAYKKIIEPKEFCITFEYGNIILGKFIPNNMNYFAGIYLVPHSSKIKNNAFVSELYKENVIRNKYHYKTLEYYQIIDKDGIIISNETTDSTKDFEQHFFDRYEVKVALRKYKLNRLKSVFE